MSKDDPIEGYSKTKWYFYRPSDQPHFATEPVEQSASLVQGTSQPDTCPDFMNPKVYCMKCNCVHERGAHHLRSSYDE